MRQHLRTVKQAAPRYRELSSASPSCNGQGLSTATNPHGLLSCECLLVRSGGRRGDVVQRPTCISRVVGSMGSFAARLARRDGAIGNRKTDPTTFISKPYEMARKSTTVVNEQAQHVYFSTIQTENQKAASKKLPVPPSTPKNIHRLVDVGSLFVGLLRIPPRMILGSVYYTSKKNQGKSNAAINVAPPW